MDSLHTDRAGWQRADAGGKLGLSSIAKSSMADLSVAHVANMAFEGLGAVAFSAAVTEAAEHPESVSR